MGKKKLKKLVPLALCVTLENEKISEEMRSAFEFSLNSNPQDIKKVKSVTIEKSEKGFNVIIDALVVSNKAAERVRRGLSKLLDSTIRQEQKRKNRKAR